MDARERFSVFSWEQPILDVEPVTLSIDNLPLGAKLDPTTNILTWIPDVDQAGDYRWTVTARDPRGGVDAMPSP